MKILLVDDEKKFVSMLAKRLELRGIKVDYCYEPTSAIKNIEKGNKYDIAILDVKMPGMSGIELKRKLSDIDPKLKFIFLTGHGSNVDYNTGISEASHYLLKPLEINDLIEVLHILVPESM